ncbi:hypothetical protein RIF29_20690 [Crotalaria pallida]|uniref:MYB transcription factor n=1 Tax=Crotalaria pallida TaxID=3830 RepID=A0AAN9FA64_CROPI
MGAHKQKWTSEEEAALKAGVVKHGAGKWRTILVDPEFEDTLRLRSNVDLKDKWRNINVSEVYGSRQKAKKAPNSKRLMALKVDKNHLAVTTVQHEEDELDAKPLAISCGTLQSSNSKGQISRTHLAYDQCYTELNITYKVETFVGRLWEGRCSGDMNSMFSLNIVYAKLGKLEAEIQDLKMKNAELEMRNFELEATNTRIQTDIDGL